MTEGTPGALPDLEKILNESLAPILVKMGELEQQNAEIITAQAELKQMNESLKTISDKNTDEIKQLNEAKTELSAFKGEREAEKAAAKKETYRKLVNEANRPPEVFDKLYPEMEKDLAAWQLANPDKVFHPVEETKLGGKSLNQAPPSAKASAHAALQKIGA